jgi:hypothetical protein
MLQIKELLSKINDDFRVETIRLSALGRPAKDE